MARVPQIIAPRIAPEPFRAPRQRIATNTAAFGGNDTTGRDLQEIGGALQKVSNDTDRIFVREQQRQSNIEMLRAKKELNDFEVAVNGPEGALATRGEQAEGVTERTQGEFEALKERVMSRVSSGARLAVEEMFSNRRRTILGSLSRHESAERRKTEVSLHEAGVEGEVDTFAAVPVNDDGTVVEEFEQRLVGNIRSHFRALAQLNGTPAEVVEQQIETAISQAHLARLNRMLGAGQGQLAKRYLEANGDKMTEADEAQVEKHVFAAATDQEAQDIADTLVGMGLGSQMAEARKIKDVKLRDALIKRIRQNAAIQNEIRVQSDRFTRRNAWGKLGKEGAALTANERALLGAGGIARWEADHQRMLAGVPTTSDSRALFDLNTLTDDELSAMSEEQLWAQRSKLSDRDFRSLVGRYQDASSRTSKTPKIPGSAGVLSNKQFVDMSVKRMLGIEAGTTPSKLSDDEAEQIAVLQNRIDFEVTQFEEANGRKADRADVRGIVARIEQQQVFEAPGFFGLTGGDRLTLEDVGDVEDAFVPQEKRTQGEVQLMLQLLRGRQSTDEAIGRAIALRRIANDTTLPPAIQDRAKFELDQLLGRPEGPATRNAGTAGTRG